MIAYLLKKEKGIISKQLKNTNSKKLAYRTLNMKIIDIVFPKINNYKILLIPLQH
jgi:hypothetical protein